MSGEIWLSRRRAINESGTIMGRPWVNGETIAIINLCRHPIGSNLLLMGNNNRRIAAGIDARARILARNAFFEAC